MNEVLITAIKERISLGYAREEIINELVATGYTAADAAAAYNEVSGNQVSAIPAPNQAPANNPSDLDENRWAASNNVEAGSLSSTEETVEPPTTQTNSTPQPQPTATAYQPLETETTYQYQHEKQGMGKRNLGTFAVVAVVILLVGGGIAYGAMSGGFSKLFNSVFQNAPYENESEMMEALGRNSLELTAHGLNLDYHFAIQEKDETAKIFDNNAVPEEIREEFVEGIAMAATTGAFPAEVDARLSISGVVDARDKENQEFNLSADVHVLAEPIIINGAGSVRLADGVLYGRVDDIPANMEAMLLGGVPTGEWIIIADENNFSLPIDPQLPIEVQQVINYIPQEVKQILVQEGKRLATLPLNIAQKSQSYLSNQAAQLGGAPLLETISEEEAMLKKRAAELLIEYPIIKFVDQPELVELNNEKVYRYDIDIDFDNLEMYLFKMVSEVEAISGETVPLSETEMRMMFAGAEPIFNEFNRLTDMAYYFRSDGTTAGLSFLSKFTFDHPDIEQQFLLEFNMTTTRQNDAMDITKPDDVYEKTLQEVTEESLSSGECYGNSLCEARQMGQEASVKASLNNARSQAELSYNANGYSYAEVCTDEDMQMLLFSAANNYPVFPQTQRDGRSGPGMIVCNDSSQSYAIIAPLLTDPDLSFCVDSTGFAGEVSPYALSSGSDTSCN